MVTLQDYIDETKGTGDLKMFLGKLAYVVCYQGRVCLISIGSEGPTEDDIKQTIGASLSYKSVEKGLKWFGEETSGVDREEVEELLNLNFFKAAEGKPACLVPEESILHLKELVDAIDAAGETKH